MYKKCTKVIPILECIVLLGSFFTGCGEKEKEVKKDYSTEIDVKVDIKTQAFLQEIQESKKEKPKLDPVTDPHAIGVIMGTAIEAGTLWFMTAEEFEDWCTDYYPEIPQHLDDTWENVDWGIAKELLYKNTFGYTRPEWEFNVEVAREFGASEEFLAEIEEIKQEEFPEFSSKEEFYLNPPEGFIANISPEEYLSYLEMIFSYSLSEEEFTEAKKMLSVLSSEEISQMLQEIAGEIEKKYFNYTYTPGDEEKILQQIEEISTKK